MNDLYSLANASFWGMIPSLFLVKASKYSLFFFILICCQESVNSSIHLVLSHLIFISITNLNTSYSMKCNSR
jgi:hypothetical protein